MLHIWWMIFSDSMQQKYQYLTTIFKRKKGMEYIK